MSQKHGSMDGKTVQLLKRLLEWDADLPTCLVAAYDQLQRLCTQGPVHIHPSTLALLCITSGAVEWVAKQKQAAAKPVAKVEQKKAG